MRSLFASPGTAPHHVARRPDHRRLHAVHQRRRLSGSHPEYFDPDSHGRTGLSPGKLQGSHRKTGCQCNRPRPGRCGWDCGTEVNSGSSPTSRFPVAPHGFFDGLIGLAAHVHMRPSCRKLHRLQYPLGQPEWWYQIVYGLPNPSSIMASSTFGTGRVSVSCSMSRSEIDLADEDRHFFDSGSTNRLVDVRIVLVVEKICRVPAAYR